MKKNLPYIISSAITLLLVLIILIITLKYNKDKEKRVTVDDSDVAVTDVFDNVSANDVSSNVVSDNAVSSNEVSDDDPMLVPNDSMIYEIMARKTYTSLCKILDKELRVGITSIVKEDDNYVTTYILDNTDAELIKIQTPEEITYTDFYNSYDKTKPIVYFENGVPDNSYLIYGQLGNALRDHVLYTDYSEGIEANILDLTTNEVYVIYLN